MRLQAAAILVSSLYLTRPAQSCSPEQPFLTMGNDESSVMFSFVSKTVCDQTVNVTLKNSDKQTMLQVPLLTNNSYLNDPKMPGYNRYSYFFTAPIIPDDHYSWSYSSDTTIGPFGFRIRNLTQSKDLKIFLMADMDLTDLSLPTRLKLNATNWYEFDALIHAGDYAYNTESDFGKRGDNYFNSLWTVTPCVPHLLISGNHENYNNSLLFEYRFRMPDYNQQYYNNFYSYRRGPAFFLFVNYDWVLTFYKDLPTFYKILGYVESELKKVANDSTVKWRSVVTHRPIYCGEFATRKDCFQNFYYLKAFEQLYRKYKVDFLLAGHEHFYERLVVLDDQFRVIKPPLLSISGPGVSFNSPGHPIQIMSGCAGNIEGVSDPLTLGPLTWTGIPYIPCWADLHINESVYHHRVFASANDTVLDQTLIFHADANPTKNSGLFGAALLLPIVFVSLILLIFVVLKLKSVYQPKLEVEAGSISGYSHPGKQEAGQLSAESEPRQQA